jgi:high affinity Mn2+ porin
MVSVGTYGQRADSLKNERFSIHAQATVINQFKPSFQAKYTGDNSLNTSKESQTSLTSTLYVGARLWTGAQVFINPEIAGGSGLSQALGIADATNGETFRIGNPAPKIYVARLFFQQLFALSHEKIYHESDQNQLGGYVPTKYLSLTIGKIGAADYFDRNSYSHDPRSQFMSWGLMDNGAWDYPANTRGYTPSIIMEYICPKSELRYGMSLLPLMANGNTMNRNISKSRSQTLEYTHKHQVHDLNGAVRVLVFRNVTNMGNYQQSIALSPQNPDIKSTRQFGNGKYGFGISAEQQLLHDLGWFFRASWNDGKNETWVFTEIDHSISTGLSLTCNYWHRAQDNVGLAFVSSGISRPHRDYLGAGGKGFILGDGALNYRNENLTEIYYLAELVKKHIYLTGAYQLITNPGYNKDRHGPVNVFSFRLHETI